MSLQFDSLTHIYPSQVSEKHRVLDIHQWQIAAGMQVLVRGVSGSGKTTLFNVAAGLLEPTTGSVHIHGQSLYDMPEHTRDRYRAQYVGYIFQNHYLLGTLSALENVVMPMAFAGQIPRSQWRETASEWLALVGLKDRMSSRPSQLSTGQRMRVGVARALANSPRVLLADEPTASLDAESAETVMDVIQAACHENNTILLVASHDPALSDRFMTVAHLHEGKLQLEEKVGA